jgi:hypothetical protein
MLRNEVETIRTESISSYHSPLKFSDTEISLMRSRKLKQFKIPAYDKSRVSGLLFSLHRHRGMAPWIFAKYCAKYIQVPSSSSNKYIMHVLRLGVWSGWDKR